MEGTEDKKLELKAYDTVYKFSKTLFEMYPKVIKSIAMFGSYAKGKETEKSDVDVMLIMDDLDSNLDEKFLGAFYSDVDKMVSAEKNVKLHVNFVTLTAFWKGAMAADPVTVNVLKYGVPIIDTGFFKPMMALLQKGEIKPTEESIYAALSRSELYTNSAKLRLSGAVLDTYWSVVNSAQALIMRNGDVPPSPEVIPEMLESLMRMNVINAEDLKTFTEIFALGKKLMHNEKIDVHGDDAERIMLAGLKFNEKMDRIVNKERSS